MRLKKLIKITFLFSLVSCGSGVPKRPSIDACKVIMQERIVYCVNNITKDDYEISLDDIDRYVAFSEDDYQQLLLYIKLLQRYTPRYIDSKLREFESINRRLIDGADSNR